MFSSPDSPSMIRVRRSSPYCLADALQLVDDDLHQQLLAGEDGAQPFDRLQELGQLVDDLLALESGQTLQLHVENGLGLDQRKAELRHQPFTRLGHRFRAADQRDDGIEMIERNLQAFEDVIAGLGLPQLEFGAPANHLAAEVGEGLDQFEQRHHLRPAADDRQHDDAEAQLQLGVLVEVVQHHLRHLAALELDDDPHPVAIGLVAQVGNPLDRLLANEIGDPLDQLRLVDLIGNLGDDDRLPVALLVGLDLGFRAHHDRAAAGHVRLHRALSPDDEAAGGKVRGGDEANQVPQLFSAGEIRLARRRARRCRPA